MKERPRTMNKVRTNQNRIKRSRSRRKCRNIRVTTFHIFNFLKKRKTIKEKQGWKKEFRSFKLYIYNSQSFFSNYKSYVGIMLFEVRGLAFSNPDVSNHDKRLLFSYYRYTLIIRHKVRAIPDWSQKKK